MKRQKRNGSQRAYTKGYKAGITGRSKSLCPHEGGECRINWMTGWREGREDHWDGFHGAAAAQRLSDISIAA